MLLRALFHLCFSFILTHSRQPVHVVLAIRHRLLGVRTPHRFLSTQAVLYCTASIQPAIQPYRRQRITITSITTACARG